jgi:NADH dehydrogenase
MAQPSGSRRVVIVGGEFADLFAASELRNAPVQVTLLDRAEHHLFQPLLSQYATGILSEGKFATPIRELL